MEALYNEGGDISYKIAIRCAFVLKLFGDDPKTVFNTVKEIYSKRSQLIHSNEEQQKEKHHIDYNDIDAILDYGKKSIIAFFIFVHTRKNHFDPNTPNSLAMKKRILNLIDDAILNSDASTKLQAELNKPKSEFGNLFPSGIPYKVVPSSNPIF